MRSDKLENKIKPILETNYSARCSDMYLYYEYIKRELKDSDLNKTFITLFFNPRLVKILGLATFGGVERCSRQIRKENPNLTVDRVERIRFEKQANYIKYSQGYIVEV